MPDKLVHPLLRNPWHAARPQARHDGTRGKPSTRHHAWPMLVDWRTGYAPWATHGHLALTHCQHLLLLGCLLLLLLQCLLLLLLNNGLLLRRMLRTGHHAALL